MKITQHSTTNLIVKDSAGCLWLFGLFFVLIAGTFVIGLMGAFNNLNELNKLEQTAAWIVSLAGVAAGLWIIYSNPVIKTDFDKREGVVKINKRGFMKNEKENYPLNEIKDIIINESKDDDSDPIFSVEINLMSEKKVSITKVWLRNKEELQNIIDKIESYLK